jgi:hypothetical protein
MRFPPTDDAGDIGSFSDMDIFMRACGLAKSQLGWSIPGWRGGAPQVSRRCTCRCDSKTLARPERNSCNATSVATPDASARSGPVSGAVQAMAPRKHAQSADLGRPEPSFWSNPLSFVLFFWYNRVLLAVGGALPAPQALRQAGCLEPAAVPRMFGRCICSQGPCARSAVPAQHGVLTHQLVQYVEADALGLTRRDGGKRWSWTTCHGACQACRCGPEHWRSAEAVCGSTWHSRTCLPAERGAPLAGSTPGSSPSAATRRSSWPGSGALTSWRRARACAAPRARGRRLRPSSAAARPPAARARGAGARAPYQGRGRAAQGHRTLEACRLGRNSWVLFSVIMASYFRTIFLSVVMHLAATAATFAFPVLLEHITEYLSTCDVRAPPPPAGSARRRRGRAGMRAGRACMRAAGVRPRRGPGSCDPRDRARLAALDALRACRACSGAAPSGAAGRAGLAEDAGVHLRLSELPVPLPRRPADDARQPPGGADADQDPRGHHRRDLPQVGAHVHRVRAASCPVPRSRQQR